MEGDEKKIITVRQIADLIDDGHTRKEIAKKLEISEYDLQQFCKHPELKGRKAGKKSNVLLKDDEGNTYTTASIRNAYGDKDQKKDQKGEPQDQDREEKEKEKGQDPSYPNAEPRPDEQASGTYQEPVSTDLGDPDQEQHGQEGTFGEDDQ